MLLGTDLNGGAARTDWFVASDPAWERFVEEAVEFLAPVFIKRSRNRAADECIHHTKERVPQARQASVATAVRARRIRRVGEPREQ